MVSRIIDIQTTKIAIIWFSLLLSTFVNSEEEIGLFVMEQVPYGFVDDSGENTGVLFDIMHDISRYSEMNGLVKILPLKRLLAALLKDKKSCSLLADAPVVVENFDLIEPIGYQLLAGVLPVRGVKLNSYDDLKGPILAVPLGIQFDRKFNDDDSLNKVTPPQYIDAIRLMKRNRVQAVAGAIDVLRFLARKEGIALHFFGQPLIFIEKDLFLVCSKALTKNERKTLQQSVIELRTSGRIQQLFTDYLSL